MMTLREKHQIVLLMLGLLMLIAGGALLIPRSALQEDRLKPSGKFGVAVAATGDTAAAPWLMVGGAIALVTSLALKER